MLVLDKSWEKMYERRKFESPKTYRNFISLRSYKNKNLRKNFWISLNTSGSRESNVKKNYL